MKQAYCPNDHLVPPGLIRCETCGACPQCGVDQATNHVLGCPRIDSYVIEHCHENELD